MLGNLPKVTEPMTNRAGDPTQEACICISFPSLYSKPLHYIVA